MCLHLEMMFVSCSIRTHNCRLPNKVLINYKKLKGQDGWIMAHLVQLAMISASEK